ncbi:hypothetical protein [Thermus oshimai]|uniref:hypothetical protein n=1 Tax=Thermus oshimai TaxID=56957 RepID=UPI0003795B88|nr:hypothetical protein [Thermus oshimai]
MKRFKSLFGLMLFLSALLSGCGSQNQSSGNTAPSQTEVEAILTALAPYIAPTYNPMGLSPQSSMSATSSVACPAGGTLTSNLTVSASETSLQLSGSLTGTCRVNRPEPTALENVNLSYQGALTFNSSQTSVTLSGNFTETGGFTLQYKGNTYQVSDLSLTVSTTDTLTFSQSGYTVSRSGSLQGTLKVNGQTYTVNKTFSGSVSVSFSR